MIKKIAAENKGLAGQKRPHEFSILVVDDNKEVCEIFHKASQALQFSMKLVEDADSAVALVKKVQFDAIFLDIFLSGRSDLTGFKSLREIRPKCKIILMVAYGHSAKDLVEEALRCGAYDRIYKPLDLKEIEELINRIKERRTRC